jgi:hypothetical protein
MLKSFKNRLFIIIEESGLSHDLFSLEETQDILNIHLIDSQLNFSLKQGSDDFNKFTYKLILFRPGFPMMDSSGELDIEDIEKWFTVWINSEVISCLEEVKLPDLWTQYADYIGEISTFRNSEYEYEEFSDDEKMEIKGSINNFRLLIIENYHPNEEQLEEINERLDYISQAVDRLNRADWKLVALSTVIGIATNLAVDIEGGRKLFGLFQEAFSYLIQLLP